jgi:hypothetical protein
MTWEQPFHIANLIIVIVMASVLLGRMIVHAILTGGEVGWV